MPNEDEPREGAKRPDPMSLDPALYETLHAIAERAMRSERHRTLHPTDLVHEAWLKLASGRSRAYADRVHFLAVASRAMRQVLVDRARARATAKRGGDPLRVTRVDELADAEPGEDVLALHAALAALEAEDADAAQVVVYRFFGGMTEVETGELMGRSERWVRMQWAYARAWLRRTMDEAQ